MAALLNFNTDEKFLSPTPHRMIDDLEIIDEH